MRRQLQADVAMALAILVLAASLWLSGWVLLHPWLARQQPRRSFGFEDAVGGLASLLGTVVVGWWLVSLLLAVVSGLLTLTGRAHPARLTGRFAPLFMHRLVLAVLGFVLAVGTAAQAAQPPVDPRWQPSERVAASPAPAAPAWSQATGPATGPALHSPEPAPGRSAVEPGPNQPPVDPLWQPQGPLVGPGTLARPRLRPIFPFRPEPAPARATARAAATGTGGGSGDYRQEVVVKAGDSLWSLAAAQLGPLATDVEVARQWPRWFQANRAVIGPDPNLLLPGQILRIP